MRGPWSSLVEGCIGPSGKLLCLSQIKKLCITRMASFHYMFDYWADPVVHLRLLKNSMRGPNLMFEFNSFQQFCLLSHLRKSSMKTITASRLMTSAIFKSVCK